MYGLRNSTRPCVHKAEACHTTFSVASQRASTSRRCLSNIKDDATRARVLEVPEGILPNVAETHSSSVIRRVAVDVNNTSMHEKRPDLRRNGGANRLPLSPFMDQAYDAAKSRHVAPKAERSKNPTSFQQRLAKNVYARALLTPVRHCVFTDTWLPSYFLQKFELITYPKTGEHWYLPRSLVRHQPLFGAVSSKNLESRNSEEADSEKDQKLGPGKYILARQSLLAATNQRQSGFTNKWQNLFPPTRAKRFKAFDQGKLRWRADVDTFVLKLLRCRVFEHMTYLAEKKDYFVECTDFEKAKAIKRLGAILWFGEASYADKFPGSLSIGEFTTLDTGREMEARIPVHDMRTLLGDDLAEELRQKYTASGADLVGLLHRNMTISLQLKLWKLQGYLAELGNYTSSESSIRVAEDLLGMLGERDEDLEDSKTPTASNNIEE